MSERSVCLRVLMNDCRCGRSEVWGLQRSEHWRTLRLVHTGSGDCRRTMSVREKRVFKSADE